jgi:hypothetical protein
MTLDIFVISQFFFCPTWWRCKLAHLLSELIGPYVYGRGILIEGEGSVQLTSLYQLF